MARIAVNTRLLQKGKLEGIGWFTFEILKRITRDHPEHDFIFIFDRPFDRSFKFAKNVTCIYAGPPTRHVILFIPWFEYVLPRLFKKHKVDLFLSTDGHIPLNTNVPCIPVIHDLNFHHSPEQLPFIVRTFYNYFFPKYAQKAARILTVSEYTKSDIVKSYGISESKIDVAYNGCNEIFKPISEEEKVSTKNKYSQGADYFLFVGLIIPRKNLHRLLDAYFKFRGKNESKIKLVVVGEKKWWPSETEELLNSSEYKDDVIFLGRVGPEELHKLMGSALALTFVPLFEGFGIPVLEAFACGTPVLTSNVTSLPEVAGNAALLCDPYDSESILIQLEKLAKDEDLRKGLALKGLRRKEAFSWDITARESWNCITKVLG